MAWIRECLTDVANDREQDNDTEPIPVVPLTEETENAMDNTAFQKLLKKLGVTPPADEQVNKIHRLRAHSHVALVLALLVLCSFITRHVK